ncbi:LysR family transcriptional regulator [Mameliella alba]|uniref:LysR family transcriptional regulator n=1 Tax=Mameliella alba TaxID=561184 RepID=UPI00315910D1
MGQITVKQLEAFVQVAHLASFHRAAERLNTTQPNISTRISALESLLRLRLFNRDAGSVRLTPTGRKILPRARAVLTAMDGFVAAAGEDHLFEGVLRLGVTEMICAQLAGSIPARPQ